MLLDEENPRIAELEGIIKKIEWAYVEEGRKLVEETKFDPDKERDMKKLVKIADKYLDLLIPLREELMDLQQKEQEKKEIERKRKYKDN